MMSIDELNEVLSKYDGGHLVLARMCTAFDYGRSRPTVDVVLGIGRDLNDVEGAVLNCGNVSELELQIATRWFRLDELRVFPKKQDQLEEVMFLITDAGHDADKLRILCEAMSIGTGEGQLPIMT